MRAPASLFLLACLAAAQGQAVPAYREGYVAGEVVTKGSYLYGTLEVQLVAPTCVGVGSGAGLVYKSSSSQHDIGLMFYQDVGAYTAYVIRHSGGVIVENHVRHGYAPGDVTDGAGAATQRGARLQIKWSAAGVEFSVNGVPLTNDLPVIGRQAQGPQYVLSGSPSFFHRTNHKIYTFAHVVDPGSAAGGTLTAQPPSATCLPAVARVGAVKFTPESRFQRSLDQPEWTAAALQEWDRVSASQNLRSMPLASQYSLPDPMEGVVNNGFLFFTVGLTQYKPLITGDEDPDLLASPLAPAWSVSHHYTSTVTGTHDPVAYGLGMMTLDVVTNTGGPSGLTVRKKVSPGAVLACSVARLRSGLARNLSITVTDALKSTVAASPTYEIPENEWRLYNACYTPATNDPVDVSLQLGAFDDVLRIHPYAIDVDFVTTMTLTRQAVAVAFDGTDRLTTWWNNRNAGSDAVQYPWVGPRITAFRQDTWHSKLVGNTANSEGDVELECRNSGDATLTHHALAAFLKTGQSYRITVTAKVTSQDTGEKPIFITVQQPGQRRGSIEVYGGVNAMFVPVNETYTYTYTLRAANVLDGVTSASLTLLMRDEEYAVGDVVTIKSVTMKEHVGSNEWPESYDLKPSLADRAAALPGISAPAVLPFIVTGETDIPDHLKVTNAPEVSFPLDGPASRLRYGNNAIVKLVLNATQYSPQTFPLEALRTALGEELTQLRAPVLSGTFTGNNVHILAVCLHGVGDVRVIVNSTLVIDRPRPRGDRAHPACRGIGDRNEDWYAHLKEKNDLEVHFYVTDLPLKASQWGVTTALVKNINNRIAVAKRIGFSFPVEEGAASSYGIAGLEVTAAPPPPPGPHIRKSTMQTQWWILIVVFVTLFCLCFGMCIAHQAIKLRNDLIVVDENVSQDGSSVSAESDASEGTTTDAAGFELVEKDPERRMSML
eukprot:TRINITY_DN914_c0_g1_i1.p1 TRINITY_DN914_c0_g1~~TRINITY_DN914_c0_g1_i1.p1  ORF type:complete len:943 (+),score=256.33 TRINITY_DN914_c0_g1_i1:115-2943(+)